MLWNIAKSVRPDRSVSMEQMMLALQRANPGAFIDNNVNNLKTGEILRVPSRDEAAQLTRKEARTEFARQTQAWRDAKLGLASAPAPQPQAPATPQSASS